MKIEGAVALVTGSNRGLGAALEAEQPELLAGAPTREVRHGLAAEPPVYLGLGS
jgi:hypothetical protein